MSRLMLGKKWVNQYCVEVVVTRGRNKGKLGLVDEWNGQRAILYLDGNSLVRGDPYETIHRRYLRLATEAESRRRQWLERKGDRKERLENDE